MLALCLALATPTLARAQDHPPAPAGFSGSAGLAFMALPTYEGSRERRGLLAPDLQLRHRSGWGEVELGRRGLVWLAPAGLWSGTGPQHDAEDADAAPRFGLLLGYEAGRRTRRGSATDPTPGDDRLAGLGPIRSGPEAGALLGWGPVQLVLRKATRRSHGGTQLELGVELPVELPAHLATGWPTLQLGLAATWADRRTMQAFFGVTPAQAQASSFAAYRAGAGLRRVDLSLTATQPLAPHWSLQAALIVSALGGDARHSPLVQRKTDAVALLGVSYAF